MWARDFHIRLKEWSDLRHQIVSLPADQALLAVNDWWFCCPWVPYYLHWDDCLTWPDPWSLLAENHFCDLARALGMYYTLEMSVHPDINNFELLQTNLGNLVQVEQGKYILNWSQGRLLNIASSKFYIQRRLDSRARHHLTDGQ